MKQHHPTLKLTVYTVLFALLFFGLLQVALQSRGYVFVLEALGTLVLALLVFAGCLAYYKSRGERIFFVVFLLVVANLLLLRAFTGSLYVIMLLVAFIGFGMSFPRRGVCQPCCDHEGKEEPHSMVFDSPKTEEAEVKTVKREAKKEAKSEEKTEDKNGATFNPGKYMASTRGNVFHEAKCDWAKKVSKTHRLWFNSKKEAEDKNYKPHSCVN
ncbi:hypothetical protein HYT55_02710 [Candidatus Woesearchaeota archaeon]|nr:hypothetical protein [Candidatus Woesearchaeota archaeon]